MSKKQNRDRSHIPKITGYVILFLPTLLVKLALFYLRFKGMASKSGKIFQEELLRQGLDEEIAEKFTKEYLKSSHFLTLMRRHS